ncbi:MAG: TSUP family transporter, partial [Planctomycetota bacterium]|nr:TSUP family transporter [Planctomycetota bacterium]
CGIVTGAIGAVSCANGPPLILYSTVRGWSAQTIKAFVQPVFIFAGVTQLIGYFYIGTVTGDLLILTAITTVPMLVATVVGMRFADRVPCHAFDKAFYSLVLLLGLILIYKGI